MSKITEEWWQRCLDDPEKLEKWLITLYNNEKDAEERFIDFANDYCLEDQESYDIFMEIASQENNHAKLVDIILNDRGITRYELSTKNGRYWSKVLPCIKDKETAAAVGAYAEGLSLQRMRVIIKYPGTPDDLIELFKVVEPEESYHAKMLQAIATKYGMTEVRECHDDGLEALGLAIKRKHKR